MGSMTTAEATVAALIAHCIDTVYALPGVHNDHLFDALFKAKDRIRTVHTRHEQGAGYMALGAALATGKPQAFAVVPGPGLLNASTALLTAHGCNAPVLALLGQIAQSAIGRGFGHLHEIRDQAGILSRLVDFAARIDEPAQAAPLVAQAMRAMRTGRPGPAALECAIDMWGRSGTVVATPPPAAMPAPELDEDAVRAAVKVLAGARRVLIVVGGGAQDAAAEVTALSDILQAPVFSFRRGRGVVDERNPFAVTMPLAHELWGETDAVLGIGTRLFYGFQQWGVDDALQIVRVDADPAEPARFRKPAAALVGDAAPVLRGVIAALDGPKRPSRRAEMVERQAKWRGRLAKLAPQIAYLNAIRDALGEDGILVDEVTQMGFAARLAYPVYKPRSFISPGFQDPLGWGYATALGVQDALRDKPVVAICGDGGFMFNVQEMSTAVAHSIPVVTIVFDDGAFGNVKKIQKESYGARHIGVDLTNPDFVTLAKSFGMLGIKAETPDALRAALREAFAARGPALIHVPVGELPDIWKLVQRPPSQGPKQN